MEPRPVLTSLNLIPGEADRVLAVAVDDVLKGHLRVDGAHDDALLEAYVGAAIDWYEDAADRSLVTATWEARWDCFPGQTQDPRSASSWWGRADRLSIHLPKSPAVAVASVKYLDANEVEQTLSSSAYVVDATSSPPTITPARGYSWPSVAALPGAVRVRFTAGYGDGPEDVPQKIQQLVRLLVAHWYDPARAPVVTGTIVNELPFALRTLFWNTRANRAA